MLEKKLNLRKLLFKLKRVCTFKKLLKENLLKKDKAS